MVLSLHILQELVSFCSFTRGISPSNNRNPCGRENGEREAAGCEVGVIIEPGKVRFAEGHAPVPKHELGQPWHFGPTSWIPFI